MVHIPGISIVHMSKNALRAFLLRFCALLGMIAGFSNFLSRFHCHGEKTKKPD